MLFFTLLTCYDLKIIYKTPRHIYIFAVELSHYSIHVLSTVLMAIIRVNFFPNKDIFTGVFTRCMLAFLLAMLV